MEKPNLMAMVKQGSVFGLSINRSDAYSEDKQKEKTQSESMFSLYNERIWEEARLNMKKQLNGTKYGIFYQNSMLVISVLSCFQFITQTYITGAMVLKGFSLVERIIAAIFIFDWTMSFCIADHKIKFVTR